MQHILGRGVSNTADEDFGINCRMTPAQLAPTHMFVALLRTLVLFYGLGFFYYLITFALNPTGNFWHVTSPLFAAGIFAVVLLLVTRGRLDIGVAFLALSISLYDVLAYPFGYVPYYWAFWNQVMVLVLVLPFTSRHVYRNISRLTIFVALILSALMLLITRAYDNALDFSMYMRNIVIGLSLIIVTYIFYRVQGILFDALEREWAARVALTETKLMLENTVGERTQALTQANDKLSRQNALLTDLHEIRLGIINHLDLHDLMDSVITRSVELLNAQEAVIYLTSEDGSRLVRFAGTNLFHPLSIADVVRGVGLIGTVWQTGQMLTVDDYAVWEYRMPGADLTDFHACIAVPLLTDNKVMGVMGVVRTLSNKPFTLDEIDLHMRLAQLASVAYDNSRLYAAVRASEQTLETRVEERTRSLQRALAENEALRDKAIADATLLERSRLARELHDSVSQAIYGISLGARAAQKIKEVGNGDLDQPLSYIVALSETALAEIRALIFEMKPESLKDEGIKAAINKHADVLRYRHGIQVKLTLPALEPAASLEVKYALYRVMQETTHNTIKHAYAHNIAIDLLETDDALAMKVRDDGIGFDATKKFPGHHGLENMAERIRTAGGEIAITSAPRAGTCVAVQIPKRVEPQTLSQAAITAGA